MYYRGSAAAVVVYDITSEVGTLGAVGLTDNLFTLRFSLPRGG